MNIQLPLEYDSDNTYTDNLTLDLRRGTTRPDNVVITLGERQVEVSYHKLFTALHALA